MTEDNDETLLDGGDHKMRLGAYQLVNPVGMGGMGTVWEGRHTSLGRRVAVKILHSELSRNPELLARFIREGQAAARISHPHAATVYDVGQEGERAYLVMEFLDGEDVAALLDREKALPASQAVDIMLPVLAAMSVAHAEGVVHRDLKPANIFLTKDRDGVTVPKVVDFGFSKVAEPEGDDEDLTRRDYALGTLSYMPVEQIRSSRTVGPASDQYALGVTLYRCVTGRMPFEGRSPPEIFAAIVKGACPRPSELAAGLPDGLDAVILRAMHASPDGRFASVKAMGAALRPYASPAAQARWADTFGPPPSLPPQAATAPLPVAPTGGAKTRTIALVVAVVVALVAIALAASQR